MEDRKRSLRFTLATDIVLLQEVNRHKPWSSPHGKIRDTWEQIAAAVTHVINHDSDPNEPPTRVDHGASKRRYDVLMDAFAKDELKSMRAKGSVELYVQREELLTDLSLQLSQYHEQKVKTKKHSTAAARNSNDNNEDAPPPASAAPSAPTPTTTTTITYSGTKRSEPSASSLASASVAAAALTSAIANHAEVKRQMTAMPQYAPPPPPPQPPVQVQAHASAPPRFVDDRNIRNNNRNNNNRNNNNRSDRSDRNADDPLTQLRAREVEVAEQRLDLDRARFENEREERAAVVAAMQANTTLLLRLVDRLERPTGHNASGVNNVPSHYRQF